MFNWKDRVYVNARKKVFKNLDTNEMLNLEIQEDEGNVLEESETPLTAYCLNQAQQELVNDMSKTYIGTNIEVDTIEGVGRINKVYGKTIEVGTGEKSPTNPYKFQCVGDDVNLLKYEDITNTLNNGLSFTKTNDSIKILGTLTQISATLQLLNIVDRLIIGETYEALIYPNTIAPFQFIIIENGTQKYVKTFTHNSNITSVVPYIQPMGASGKVISGTVKIKVSKKKNNVIWSPYRFRYSRSNIKKWI